MDMLRTKLKEYCLCVGETGSSCYTGKLLLRNTPHLCTFIRPECSNGFFHNSGWNQVHNFHLRLTRAQTNKTTHKQWHMHTPTDTLNIEPCLAGPNCRESTAICVTTYPRWCNNLPRPLNYLSHCSSGPQYELICIQPIRDRAYSFAYSQSTAGDSTLGIN